jgi:hypothetical protein
MAKEIMKASAVSALRNMLKNITPRLHSQKQLEWFYIRSLYSDFIIELLNHNSKYPFKYDIFTHRPILVLFISDN